MRRITLHEQLCVFVLGALGQVRAAQNVGTDFRRECPCNAPLAGAAPTFQRNDGALT